MPFARILRSSALLGGAQVVVMAPASKSDVQYPLQLGWAPRADFQSGLRQTVGWYLDHPAWTQAILGGSYRL
ncbi:MAG: hypothetical protein RLZZ162_2402 [Verrucomicrobiota bacterium]|jgi:nucleoside-diphosphate-sugar epimerase